MLLCCNIQREHKFQPSFLWASDLTLIICIQYSSILYRIHHYASPLSLKRIGNCLYHRSRSCLQDLLHIILLQNCPIRQQSTNSKYDIAGVFNHNFLKTSFISTFLDGPTNSRQSYHIHLNTMRKRYSYPCPDFIIWSWSRINIEAHCNHSPNYLSNWTYEEKVIYCFIVFIEITCRIFILVFSQHFILCKSCSSLHQLHKFFNLFLEFWNSKSFLLFGPHSSFVNWLYIDFVVYLPCLPPFPFWCVSCFVVILCVFHTSAILYHCSCNTVGKLILKPMTHPMAAQSWTDSFWSSHSS